MYPLNPTQLPPRTNKVILNSTPRPSKSHGRLQQVKPPVNPTSQQSHSRPSKRDTKVHAEIESRQKCSKTSHITIKKQVTPNVWKVGRIIPILNPSYLQTKETHTDQSTYFQ